MYVLSSSSFSLFTKVELYRRRERSIQADNFYVHMGDHLTWNVPHDQYACDVSSLSEIQYQGPVVCLNPLTIVARIYWR